ncbi:Protein of unknown function [Cotesia congregata]|uniref:Uncharacterized protein n=1 Tax=Cotesia congregata TaxID=51543 RepID=A0A8J2HE33_COTCN|nr:Protein of unknown function [Cotesia congregata]
MDSTCPSRNPIHGDLSALSSRQDLGLLRPWRLWERSRSAGWFAESAVGSDSIGATAAMDWATWPARAGQGRTGAVAAGGVVRWITSRRPVLSLRAAISMKRWEAGEPLITWRVLDGARPIGRYSKRKMAKVLQINLHRCKLALDLLYARNRDNGMDIVLVSEQYHSVSGPNWYCDPTGTAAIWIPDQSRLSVPDSGARDGIVWVETPAVTVVSVRGNPPTVPEREMKQTGWKVSLLDESAFQNAVSDRIDTLTDSFAESRENVESLVGRTMDRKLRCSGLSVCVYGGKHLDRESEILGSKRTTSLAATPPRMGPAGQLVGLSLYYRPGQRSR